MLLKDPEYNTHMQNAWHKNTPGEVLDISYPKIAEIFHQFQL